MHAEVARLDLRLRRRSLIWYAVGMAVYAFLIVAMYPAMKADTGLESLAADNPTLMALFGVSGSLTSPVGWVNGNLYANFLPLLLLLITVAYGAAAVAGQADEGALGLVATLPLSRARLVAEKAGALVVLALPLSAVTLTCVLLGREYDLNLAVGPLVGTTAAATLLAVDFGLLALLIGALTGSRGLALGLSSAVAAASYLVSSLAPAVHAFNTVRGVSLFYWAVGDGQLEHGPSGLAWAVLLVVGAALLVGSVVAVRRLDIP